MAARSNLIASSGEDRRLGLSPKRRSWSAPERQRIVESALAPGVSVAQIARQNGLNANLVFKWIRRSREGWLDRRRGPRSDARERAALTGDEQTTFVPVRVVEAQSAPPAVAAPAAGLSPKPRREAWSVSRRGAMEISLPNGARICVDVDVNPQALCLVLSALGHL